uniref:Uncharacterized protein n=1 Tax=Plectus sambesii TaxID=2011161 RepID=A0A914UVT9_9BILA
VPKMRVTAETPTPTSEGMSLFQRLTQGRSGSTSQANRTPTSPSKGMSRHLSDASDLRPHTSSSMRDRDVTLQTVDEIDSSNVFSLDPTPSPQPRATSRMSSLAVEKGMLAILYVVRMPPAIV